MRCAAVWVLITEYARLNKRRISTVKKKITILMLVSAILCSIAVPAVMADEKTVAADIKVETKAETKTEVKADTEPEAAKSVEAAVTATADTKVQPTANPDIDAVSTAAPTSEPEATPEATGRPIEKFRNNPAVIEDNISATSAPSRSGASFKPEGTLKPGASAKPDSSAKPEGTLKPGSTIQPSASPNPSASPVPSAAPSASPLASPASTANPELTETQTKSVTGTVKSITDKKISINVSEGVVEEYLYGAPIKDIRTGDSVMLTYDPKVGYMERIYEAPDDFVKEVKFVDFTVSKLNSLDLSDSITNGDLCGLIYNMLVYNEKITDLVKTGTVKGTETSKKSIVEAAELYTAEHPEAKDTIKVLSTGAPSQKKTNMAKSNLNALKAQALCEMGYVSEKTVNNIDKEITREDAAVILATVYTKTVTSGKTSSSAESYSDEKNISSEAKSSVLSLQKAGIMTSNGNSFKPQDEYTEADAIIDLLKIEELF